MDLGKIPHLVEKSGQRFYWQPSKSLREAGFPTERLPNDRAAAIARARELNAGVEAWRMGRSRVPGSGAGTLGALINAYRASPEFKGLMPSTQKGYRWALTRLEAWGGDVPVGAIDAPRLKKSLYRKLYKTTPAAANAIMRVARLLFAWGLSEGRCHANPAKLVPIRGSREAPVIWPRAAVAHFAACADALGRPSIGTAVIVNEWMGQRQGDVLAFPRARYREGAGLVTQSKTGATVALPVGMVPALADRLDAEAERQKKAKVTGTTLIVSEATGRGYKADDFRHWMRWIQLAAGGEAGLDHIDTLIDAASHSEGANTPEGQARITRLRRERNALGRAIATLRAGGIEPRATFTVEDGLKQDGEAVALLDLDFMHLRHTAVTRLAGAGCTAPEIAAITGHALASVEKILNLYLVRNAELARNAFAKRLAHEEENAP